MLGTAPVLKQPVAREAVCPATHYAVVREWNCQRILPLEWVGVMIVQSTDLPTPQSAFDAIRHRSSASRVVALRLTDAAEYSVPIRPNVTDVRLERYRGKENKLAVVRKKG